MAMVTLFVSLCKNKHRSIYFISDDTHESMDQMSFPANPCGETHGTPRAQLGGDRDHRLMEWLRLEGTSKLIKLQPVLWAGSPLPGQAAQGPIQGWGQLTGMSLLTHPN